MLSRMSTIFGLIYDAQIKVNNAIRVPIERYGTTKRRAIYRMKTETKSLYHSAHIFKNRISFLTNDESKPHENIYRLNGLGQHVR